MSARYPLMPLLETFPGPAPAGLVLTAVAVLWVVLLVRLVGLRSLSKMTGFDFVTTIAVGSLIGTAGTAGDWNSFLQAMCAIAALFAVQWLFAKWRTHSDFAQRLVGNEPLLLMENGRFIDEAMQGARITRADIYSKMREAGALDQSEVRAVVLERTGDISIIKGDAVDERIMSDVRNWTQR